MSTATGLPTRAEIQPEHTWDAASIFPDDAAWEAALVALADDIPALEQYRDHLADGPGTLADWFAASEVIIRRIEHAADGFNSAIRRQVFDGSGKLVQFNGKGMDTTFKSNYLPSRDRYQVGVPQGTPLN